MDMELKDVNVMEINCGGCDRLVYLSLDTKVCPYCGEEFDSSEVKVLFDAYKKVAIEHNKEVERLKHPPSSCLMGCIGLIVILSICFLPSFLAGLF